MEGSIWPRQKLPSDQINRTENMCGLREMESPTKLAKVDSGAAVRAAAGDVRVCGGREWVLEKEPYRDLLQEIVKWRVRKHCELLTEVSGKGYFYFYNACFFTLLK